MQYRAVPAASERPRRLSDDACGASINACELVRYWSGALELLQRMRLHRPWALGHMAKAGPLLRSFEVQFGARRGEAVIGTECLPGELAGGPCCLANDASPSPHAAAAGQALLEQMSLRAELGIITCAAVLTACSVARQWLQCLQAGIVQVARVRAMGANSVSASFALPLPAGPATNAPLDRQGMCSAVRHTMSFVLCMLGTGA